MKKLSVVILAFVATLAASRVDAQTPRITGRWEIKELPDTHRIQIIFFRAANSMTGSNYAYTPLLFRGLTREQIVGAGKTAAHFDIVRDAGTFVCEGNFNNGLGMGTFSFLPDPSFIAKAATLGVSDVASSQLFEMALYEVGYGLLEALRAAGIGGLTGAQVVRMGTQGVTAPYIQGARQLGLAVTASDLVAMRVHGVDLDFAQQVRQLYPTASVQNLIELRIHGLDATFARNMRKDYPLASLGEVLVRFEHGISR